MTARKTTFTRNVRTAIAALLVAGMGAVAQAELITFDTLVPTADSIENGITVRPGALTGLELGVGGVTVSIYRENNAVFDLVDNTIDTQVGKDPEWGSLIPDGEEGLVYKSVSLDFFADTTNDAVIISFSDVIHTFSANVGDWGIDLDTLWLFAYDLPDAQGDPRNATPVERQLGISNSPVWTDTRFSITSPEGFRSVKFIGGSNDLSVFMDRIFFTRNPNEPVPTDGSDPGLDDAVVLGDDVDIIPEPTTLAMLSLIGAGALMRRR